ncbi:HD family phosphohydrolase [Synechocystis sp. PCC 7509]|uniref:HD family phosphohydrolase n=1 Tax=Synechocystis sp. PCC 7509 TaxID=927677 RepID=UPI0002AC397C|nr:HDIG domain-containing metalloprotein [Synechocystis sp. PCC 7509]
MKKLRLFDFQKNQGRQQKLLSHSRASTNQNFQKLGFLSSFVTSWLKLWRGLEKYHSIAVFCLTAIALTTVLGHRFYNQPRLAIGTIAPQTITAPYNVRVEDIETTKAERKAARTIAAPILKINETVNQQVQAQLQVVLDSINESRSIAGSFPFVETSTLSISVQRYLRSCPKSDWKLVTTTLLNQSGSKNQPSMPANNPTAEAIIELQAHSWRTSPQTVAKLINKITQIRQQYSQAKAQDISDSRELPNNLLLLELSDKEWKITQAAINNSSDRILTQGIAPGLPPDIIQSAINIQLKSPDPNTRLPKTVETWARELLIDVLQPNLVDDVAKTKKQAEYAALAVNTVMLEVQQGETIVTAGQEINHTAFVLLDRFDLSRREINWYGLWQLGFFVSAALGVFTLVKRQLGCNLQQRDRILAMLLTLSTILIATLGVNYTSLPAIGLLLGSFYGRSLGFAVIALVTVLLPASLGIDVDYLLAGAAGGVLASSLAGKMRSREELALLGVAVGLIEATVFLLIDFIFNQINIGWYVRWQQAGLVGLSGLAWSIVAIGLSPYLEYLFDLVTPIRLAELANPNRPLLKRLATNAPGTFQHTLFVSTLAEAAAKELACNVELVRAGTFYHDIGKLHDPQSFIENQMGGPNKHDEINNPWLSAEIIKKHVSAGLAMARKYRLPKAVRAFIPEHQGTILIAYFHHQAQQLAAEVDNPSGIVVDERNFRYDGPIPQSPETGIVMLADACEAALRSLKDATYEEALAMVNKILRSRWQDNQMINSGLTRDQMSRIAEIFVKVWLQFHHKRIAYPKASNS